MPNPLEPDPLLALNSLQKEMTKLQNGLNVLSDEAKSLSAHAGNIQQQITEMGNLLKHVGQGDMPSAKNAHPVVAPLLGETKEESYRPKASAVQPVSKVMEKMAPIPKKPVVEAGPLEKDMAVKWLSRVGMVILLIGMVLGLCYTYPSLSREVKLLLGAVLTAGFYWGGSRLEEKHLVLARILQGGGITLGYVLVFGMFFIPELQLMDQYWVGWGCLMGYVSFGFWLAHKKGSQTMALLSLVFGYFTSIYAEFEWVAYLTTCILSAVTLGFAQSLRPEWQSLRLVTVAGGLVTFMAWMGKVSPAMPVEMPLSTLKYLFLGVHFTLCHIASTGWRGRADGALMLVNALVGYVMWVIYTYAGAPFECRLWVEHGYLAWTMAGILAFSALFRRFLTVASVEEMYQAPWQDPWEENWHCLSIVSAASMAILATVQASDGHSLPFLLGGEAVLLAYAAKRGLFSRSFKVLAMLGMLGAYVSFICTLFTAHAPDWQGLATLFCLVFATAWMDRKVYRFVAPELITVCWVGSQLLVFGMTFPIMHEAALTMTWAVMGLVLLTIGLLDRARAYRYVGFVWFGLALLKLGIWDTLTLSVPLKILAYTSLGASLLGASFLYSFLAKRLLNEETGRVVAVSGPETGKE